VGIGAYSSIEGAILDKNARIGECVLIRPFPRGVDMDCGNWFVRDGIVIIPKDAEIPDYTLIVPEAFSFNETELQSARNFCFDIVPFREAVSF
jgi:glucose-1-phosphate adenylyltransferase